MPRRIACGDTAHGRPRRRRPPAVSRPGCLASARQLLAEDGPVESLTELRERREFQCRLRPERALRSLDEADAFLRDRGLLTRSADCALPSLYQACHEDPYKPGSQGFGAWPATKWPWFGELAGRGYLVAAVHRGKNLLVTGEWRACSTRSAARRSSACALPAAAVPGCWIILPPRDHPASMTCAPSRAQAAGAEVAAGTAGAVRPGGGTTGSTYPWLQ